MRVGIVGAGITGLALTHYLAEHDIDSVAFEANDTAGGVIESHERNGVVLEYGPQRFRLSDAVHDLATTAGVADDFITADEDLPLYVYADGKLREAPLSLSAFLRTDLLSTRSKLRLLLEPFTDSIAADETAAEAFRRKFGAEAYENLIGPLYGGTYASDPAAMPAEHALTGLIRVEDKHGSLLRPAVHRLLGGSDRSPPVTVAGGNQRLPTGLADTYASRLQMETPITSIRETDDQLILEHPGGEAAVDTVVVTVPAEEAATLLSTVGDGTEQLANLTYNPLAYVFLRTEHATPGLGYQIRRSEPLRTLGVTWNGVAFDRDNLVTCFLGGMTDPSILEESDAALGDIAATEFETVTGSAAEVITVTRNEAAIPAYDDSWKYLDEVSLPDAVHLATNYTARVGVPGRIREAKRLASSFADQAAPPR